MTYAATLEFLYEQLPMFQRVGAAAFKKDLGNIRRLLDYLGQPQERFASVHVGGTNGKGSVSHLLSAAFQTLGLKTGLYTSPHYRDFRERIKIDGQYISEAAVIAFVERIRPVLAEIRPSFFEITVAMAFEHFARERVDMAIVEVGLGGRLDSTNVLLPDLSVITNISYDHQQFLGDTLPQIAGEKAGIIKSGVPVVIGETQPEVRAVFTAAAAARTAEITFADQHVHVSEIDSDLRQTRYRVTIDGELRYPDLAVGLHGPYQPFNVQTALQALRVWLADRGQELGTLPQVAWPDLRERTKFLGRWQIIGEAPLTLVDSAHNVGGLQPVMERLLAFDCANRHIVLGVVNDKDLAKIWPLFPPEARYYFAKANIPRGLPAADLRRQAAAHGLRGRDYPSVAAALAAARRAAGPEDLIFVGGSIFTVAEVL
jgi:dihydrofolate synthase/folylpolyglutamate synthase